MEEESLKDKIEEEQLPDVFGARLEAIRTKSSADVPVAEDVGAKHGLSDEPVVELGGGGPEEQYLETAALDVEFGDGKKLEIKPGSKFTLNDKPTEVVSVKEEKGKISVKFKFGNKESEARGRTKEEWESALGRIYQAGKLTLPNKNSAEEDRKIEHDPNDVRVEKVSNAFGSIIANNKDMFARDRSDIIDNEIVPSGKIAVDVVFTTMNSYFRLREPEGDLYRQAVLKQEYLGSSDIQNIITIAFKRIIENQPDLQPYIEDRLQALITDGHDSSQAKDILLSLGNRDEKLIESALSDDDAICVQSALKTLGEGKGEQVMGVLEKFSKRKHPVGLTLFETAYEYFLKYHDSAKNDILNKIFRFSVDYFRNCREHLSGTIHQNIAQSTLSKLAKLASLAGKKIRPSTITILTARPDDKNDPIEMLKQDLGLE
jgi:hypothetical protein